MCANLLVFEVDSAASSIPWTIRSFFPYKGTHMRRVFAAFREMLLARAMTARNGTSPNPVEC